MADTLLVKVRAFYPNNGHKAVEITERFKRVRINPDRFYHIRNSLGSVKLG